jgi:hypothetical protein
MAGPQLHPAVEGQTEPIVHQLLSDGAAVLIQAMTVELILEKSDGTEIDTSTKVTNLDDATEDNKGKVKYEPAAEDLVAAGGNYYLRWRVTDGDGKVAFWPNGEAARLKVYPVAKP